MAATVLVGSAGITAVTVTGESEAGRIEEARPAAAHVLALAGDNSKKRTLPRTETRPFSMVGVSWADETESFDGSAQIRTRAADGGSWSDWRDLDFEVRPPDSAEGGAAGVRGASEPLWVGASDAIEARVVADGKQTAVPGALRLDMIDPGEDVKGKGNGKATSKPRRPRASAVETDTPVEGSPSVSATTRKPEATRESSGDASDQSSPIASALPSTAPSSEASDEPGPDPEPTGSSADESPTATPTTDATSTPPGDAASPDPTDGATSSAPPAGDPTTPPAATASGEPTTSSGEPEPTGTAPDGQPTGTPTAEPAATSAVSPTQTPEPSEPTESTDPTVPSAPDIVDRSAWGADESLVADPPAYLSELDAVFVHHTAGTNAYDCADSPSIIRAILTYHVKTNGWNDTGYNFFVDKCGTVFEGRAGGVDRPVLGAHTYGFNSYSAGISVLGDYENGGKPSAAAEQAVADVAAWKLGLHGVSPQAKVTLTAAADTGVWKKGQAATLHTISGHRDGYATLCPGASLYAALPGIRTTAGISPYAKR
ncbi:N-acetylmuramoyl-L-alanine amidase [Streptomyces sp. NPDC060194]|uniref:peptidoglycan recognition protein family protein n=1 Tax=Streptomyces sp. NPDC060194 TaxID=3347069 RepID=UPI00364ED381